MHCPQGPRSHLSKDGRAGMLRKSLRVEGLAEDRVPQSTAESELERSWKGGLTGCTKPRGGECELVRAS